MSSILFRPGCVQGFISQCYFIQGMYAIESKGVPKFRQFIEDMNYFATPSRFPLHTAYLEVGSGLLEAEFGNLHHMIV